jgi:hypothetical protein
MTTNLNSISSLRPMRAMTNSTKTTSTTATTTKPLHSSEVLARELTEAGLFDMAQAAREGRYHDYLSTLPLPSMQLDHDLAKAVSAGSVGAVRIRQRHRAGRYDAPASEAVPLPRQVRAYFREMVRNQTDRPKPPKGVPNTQPRAGVGHSEE